MRGKILLLLTVLLVLVVIGIIKLGQKGEKVVSPIGDNQKTSEVNPINLKAKLKTFEDPAGFLFKYPEKEFNLSDRATFLKISKYPTMRYYKEKDVKEFIRLETDLIKDLIKGSISSKSFMCFFMDL